MSKNSENGTSDTPLSVQPNNRREALRWSSSCEDYSVRDAWNLRPYRFYPREFIACSYAPEKKEIGVTLFIQKKYIDVIQTDTAPDFINADFVKKYESRAPAQLEEGMKGGVIRNFVRYATLPRLILLSVIFSVPILALMHDVDHSLPLKHVRHMQLLTLVQLWLCVIMNISWFLYPLVRLKRGRYPEDYAASRKDIRQWDWWTVVLSFIFFVALELPFLIDHWNRILNTHSEVFSFFL